MLSNWVLTCTADPMATPLSCPWLKYDALSPAPSHRFSHRRPFTYITTMSPEDSAYASSPVNQRANSQITRLSTTSDRKQTRSTVSRPFDLPRHMLIHAKDKEDLWVFGPYPILKTPLKVSSAYTSMFQCPFPEYGHKTLQKSNLETHIRIQRVSVHYFSSFIHFGSVIVPMSFFPTDWGVILHLPIRPPCIGTRNENTTPTSKLAYLGYKFLNIASGTFNKLLDWFEPPSWNSREMQVRPQAPK